MVEDKSFAHAIRDRDEGNTLEIGSTGTLDVYGTANVQSGGSLDIKSTASFKIAGTAVSASAAQLNSARYTKWPMAAFGAWELANDGARTNGGGIVGDVTLSYADPTLAVVYDHGTTTYAVLDHSSDLTGWTSDYQLAADAGSEEAGTDSDGQTDGDAAYFGHSLPFCEPAFDFSDAGTPGECSAKTWRWEYYNGTQWNQLNTTANGFHDSTDTANADGEQSFEQDGAIHFIPPSDWASAAVSGVSAYWIRARIVDSGLNTAPVTNETQHEMVNPTDGFKCPHAGVITDIRAINTASTLHSGTTVKFILMNFTTGAHSGELTWATSQRQDAWSSLTLAVNAGDELGVLVTQEDSGNNDPTNAMLEVGVTLA